MNSSVDSYIELKKEWIEALTLLREIFASVELEENVKWGIPTYTLNNKNVVAFSAFKSYVGIWFFHGSFLSDSAKKLMNAQEGITRGQRQWRFQNPEEIMENHELILLYLEEAIQNQRDGKVIKAQRDKAIEIPEELKLVLKNNPLLKDGFENLSKSKQREYCEYITQAKSLPHDREGSWAE